MICLGIETSCDDTGLALVQDGRILGETLSSQAPAHAVFGGVVPELASREHERHIGRLFDALLQQSGVALQEINAVAATRGPGLLGSLLVGASFAKTLAAMLNCAFIGINHLHAHILAVGISEAMQFPALGLVASGGHTEIYRMDGYDKFTRLGRTLDDAAGEAFDKAGAAAGLAYPAGRAIDQLAARGSRGRFALPAPYLANDNLDFSFSGLKTAAVTLARELRKNGMENDLPDFCASLNWAVCRAIAEKCRRALEDNPDINTLYMAGGVAANSMLRETLNSLMRKRGGKFASPPLRLCMDNGAMIAHAGEILINMGYYHELDAEAIPRGRKMPDDYKKRTFTA